MPAAHPSEFRRRAVELARLREKPIAAIAKDLGISESCLRGWVNRADINEGNREGVTSDERAELVRLRRELRVKEWRSRSSTGLGLLCSGERAPKIVFRLVQELADDGIDVAVTCRVLGVSRSGYYEWRERPLSPRDLADAYLANTVVEVHKMSRGSYGAPRMHAELRMELGIRVGRKRIARLLRLAGRAGIGGNTHKKRRKKPAPAPHEDLVQRRFVADEPNRLWCTDITEHPTGTGKVYCCAVLDVFSRTIVGWSIADHMRSELVVDALQMAT